jgi:hypothetical protein
MSQTVIGFFDDREEAQKAIERLQSAGISRDRVDLSGGSSGAATGSSNSSSGSPTVNPVSGSARDENSVSRTSDDRTVDPDNRNTNKFTDFFNNLFGGSDNDDDSKRYSHVASNSNTILTVHAQSKEEAEQAADILDDCGAVNVDERASQYGYTSSQSGTMSGTSDSIGEQGGGNLSGRSDARLRSRIFDRRIEDDNLRLRGTDTNSDLGGTGNISL